MTGWLDHGWLRGARGLVLVGATLLASCASPRCPDDARVAYAVTAEQLIALAARDTTCRELCDALQSSRGTPSTSFWFSEIGTCAPVSSDGGAALECRFQAMCGD